MLIQPTEFDKLEILKEDFECYHERYRDKNIYKYLYFQEDESISSFCQKPTIKFSTKYDLNDPFELSRKWEDFLSSDNRAKFSEYIKSKILSIIFSDEKLEEYIETELFEKMNKSQREKFFKLKKTKLYKSRLKEFRLNYDGTELNSVDQYLSTMNEAIKIKFDELIGKIGISSYTSNPTNNAMWALYASSGRGFVIEYKIKSFPVIIDTDFPRLHKVNYGNFMPKDFFDNPLSVFLQKDPSFAFEREWREIELIDSLCKKTFLDKTIYTRELNKGDLKSIIIGYNAKQSHIEILNRIKDFDESIIISTAILDQKNKKIVIQ